MICAEIGASRFFLPGLGSSFLFCLHLTSDLVKRTDGGGQEDQRLSGFRLMEHPANGVAWTLTNQVTFVTLASSRPR